MKYPIFDSIVNSIETDLQSRSIHIDTFRTWSEPVINATGLELGFKLNEVTNTIKKVSINMDWDKFREAKMAKELKGMEAHPYAKETIEEVKSVRPAVDVEVLWIFDEKLILDLCGDEYYSKRLEIASAWMENINKRTAFLLQNDEIMTRWHVELEGDLKGRYVSNMSLISYFQYTLNNCHTILDVHEYIRGRLRQILSATQRLILVSKDAIPLVA